MSSQSHQKASELSRPAPRGWRATTVAVLAITFVGAAIGFVGFLSQLRGAEIKPAGKADGIVVLTGGSSRVSDAMELLAGGYGKRLLISGVHPTNAASDISRSLSDNQSLLNCCVDLDRSAVNTRSSQMLLRAQYLAMVKMAARGIRKVGMATITQNASTK